MTLRVNTFNNGGNDGDVVTSTSMAADGNAATAVTSNLTYSEAAASHGLKGVTSTSAAAAASVRCAVTGSKNFAARMYVRVDPVPTADMQLLQFGTGGSSFTRLASLHINAAGRLRLCDSTGTTPGLWTSAAALSNTTTYLIEMVAQVGTTTGNGVLKVSYRALGDASPIESPFTSSTANLGTVNLTDFQFGKRTAAAYTVWFDEIAWEDAATAGDFLGPKVAAPTISITNQAARAVVDARGSSSGDGTGLTYSCSPMTGVTEAVDGLFLIAEGASAATYTITVTQSGAPYTQTVTVAPVAVGEIRPAIYVKQSGGTWE